MTLYYILQMVLLTFLVANLITTIKRDKNNTQLFCLLTCIIILSGGLCIFSFALNSFINAVIYAIICISMAAQYEITFK